MDISIPQDVILIWVGTNAGIPANWSRETTLDDKFVKGWGDAVAPNLTGGATTHTHTSSAHSHTLSAHTHTITLSTITVGGYNGRNSGPSGAFKGNHYHTGESGGISSGGDTSSDSTTYGAFSNNPPYRSVIFIKAGAGAQIETNIVSLWGESDTAPTNWSKVTELADRYLKGATTGADSDLTTDSGSLTNSHDITHTHTSTSAHSHSNGTSGGNTRSGYIEETSGTDILVDGHTHTMATNSATATVNENTDTLVTAETVEPAYRRLHAIKASASAEKVVGVIGMWLGATGSIPSGWSLYTAMKDMHLKIGDPTTAATGGSNTHTHAAQGHTHTGAAHTHTGGSVSAHSNTKHQTGVSDTSNVAVAGDGNHTISSVANNSTTYASANTTADSSSNEPAYRTVAFIKYMTVIDITKNNSTKAYIYYKDVTSSNSVKAALREGYAVSFSKADIIRINESKNNSVKASIVTMNLANSTSTKSSIVTTNSNGVSVRALIQAFSFTKQFEYRVYDAETRAYVNTWSNDVISEPRFKMVINSGPGEMMVKLARFFDEFGEGVDVKLFNMVECWVYDRDAPNGLLLYSGYISGYKPVMEELKEYVEITLLPYASELSYFILRDGTGATEITQTSLDPSQIFTNILNYYISDGGTLRHTASTIDTTSTSVSYTFKTYTIKDALDKAIQLTPQDWYWRVDADNYVYLKLSDLNTADHTFLIGRDINHLETWRRGEDLFNRIYFVGAETAGTALYRVYSNSASISSYGIHGYKQVDSRVTATGTADIMANRTLAKKKDPEIRTSLIILDSNGVPHNRGYDIESIKPGQTMRIRNIKQPSKTVTQWDIAQWDVDVWDQTLAYQAADIIQIQAVSYSPNSVTIEASSRTPEISKRVEDINKNWEENAAKNTPTTPTVV